MTLVLAAPGLVAPGARLVLDEEEAHHLVVRRAREGEAVTVLDGAGARGAGRLEVAGKGFAVVVERVAHEPPPAAVTLAVGAGDRDRFALVAEQAVQLGATRLVPLETARTAGVAARLRPQHLERLRRRAREALKQCGAAWEVALEAPVALDVFLAATGAGARWFADHAGTGVPRLGAGEALTVLVGPEGGFTAAERDRILSAGWQPVALGPHILRFETAALAALSTAWQARRWGFDG